MKDEQESDDATELIAKGKRQFRNLGGLAILIMLLLMAEEIVTWHGLGFVITQFALLVIVTLTMVYVGNSGKIRWLLFMVLLAAGANGFLLGGLHLTDPKEAAIDPLCYWLAIAGLGLIGIGGYVIYSLEIDAYLKDLRKEKS
jgi:hypothetical protein